MVQTLFHSWSWCGLLVAGSEARLQLGESLVMQRADGLPPAYLRVLHRAVGANGADTTFMISATSPFWASKLSSDLDRVSYKAENEGTEPTT